MTHKFTSLNKGWWGGRCEHTSKEDSYNTWKEWFDTEKLNTFIFLSLAYNMVLKITHFFYYSYNLHFQIIRI